ncbi:hypothetical protein H257_13301 [Aphanomyces astaci]|uniref:Uncharacterized protein n=1 Tax=Aphanomyces astaci TaxID=112090 RepID=W4FV79_APHAT|nr:hypothetical protein H257_13301 [Aphanomyces astaci]ETV71415.1 hypothetical protein H257_13301 [Aphanomyces astaci]|eukprot:XP_009839080.1 hypothetical protein H257_13301 [Aphanomyces astaci]
MQLIFDGPFAGPPKPAPSTPQCHYCSGSRLNMNADDACGVCKRPEIPAWLAVPKMHVGMRFILRGAVSTFVGVVTGINVLKRTVDVVTASKSTATSRHPTFTKRELSASALQSNMHGLPLESHWHATWDAYGFCQHCGLTYHVHRIPNQPTMMGSVAEQLETANVALEELVALKLKRKAQGATSRELVQLSIQVKTHQQSIWQLQQLREQCQGSWCPHCGHSK